MTSIPNSASSTSYSSFASTTLSVAQIQRLHHRDGGYREDRDSSRIRIAGTNSLLALRVRLDIPGGVDYARRLGANPPNTPTASACAPTESGNSTTATRSCVRGPSNGTSFAHLPASRAFVGLGGVCALEFVGQPCPPHPPPSPRRRHPRRAPRASQSRRANCDVEESVSVDDEHIACAAAEDGVPHGRVRARCASSSYSTLCEAGSAHSNLARALLDEAALGRPAAPSPSNPRVLPSESYRLPRRTLPLLLRGFADLPTLLVVSRVSATLLCIPATSTRAYISYLSYSLRLSCRLPRFLAGLASSRFAPPPTTHLLKSAIRERRAYYAAAPSRGRAVEGTFQPAISMSVRPAHSLLRPVHQGGTDGRHAESIPLICTRVLAQDAGSSARAGRGAARRQWRLPLDIPTYPRTHSPSRPFLRPILPAQNKKRTP
ncbi:hypothetical protein C8R44DRAFT_879095 [Mycena epipterygia]|nr:hypothetical protein C8R44DRAFT_879095 [Mycena epipterygia]